MSNIHQKLINEINGSKCPQVKSIQFEFAIKHHFGTLFCNPAFKFSLISNNGWIMVHNLWNRLVEMKYMNPQAFNGEEYC